MELQTVEGPLDVNDISLVLPHEHVFVNMGREFMGNGVLHDVDIAVEECSRLQAIERRPVIVDLTSNGLGRSPLKLREVAQRSGVPIVAGAGFYRDPYLDIDYVNRRSVDQLAEDIIREVVDGIDGSDVRAGVIGEVGCAFGMPSAAEERAIRAAARAHHATGLTISLHASRWPSGIPVVDLLREEGVPGSRIIVGHCDSVSEPGYDEAMLAAGAFLQFDMLAHTLSEFEENARVRRMTQWRDAGFLSRLLVSHDTCLRSNLSVHGGVGYLAVSTTFSDRLRRTGWSDDEIRSLTVDNPISALAGAQFVSRVA